MQPRRFVLLNPGPVNVSPRVRAAFEQTPDLCHREPEVGELVRSIGQRLVRCFTGASADYGAVALTGSGTLAVEAMIACGVGAGELLVINNGVYGQRIADMARAHEIAVVEVRSGWTDPLDLDAVESALRAHPRVEAIAVVHHETTTGLLNPVREAALLARRHGKRFLVDSVSGLGGDAIDLVGDGVDFCAGTANKCIQGLPGISFVLFRRAALKERAAQKPRSVYLDLAAHHGVQEQASMLFTMAVQVAAACDEALAELEEETVTARVARYGAAADFLRRGFADLGLHLLIENAALSNTLTALRLPPGLEYERLHASLKQQGFIVYAGQGKLGADVFRVANMGHLTQSDFAAFLAALGGIVRGGR